VIGGRTNAVAASLLAGRLVAFFLFVAAPAGAFTVTLHDAEVSGREIRLGDVVTLGGVASTAAAEIAAMPIGTAPAPGSERMIPLETIRIYLLRAGFLPGQIALAGCRPPVVTRPGRIVASEEIGRTVIDRLRSRIAPGMEVSVTRVSALPMLPPGPLAIEVEALRSIERHMTVAITVSAGGETARGFVTLKAVRPGVVVTAARRLERGHVITASDLTTRAADLMAESDEALSDARPIIGQLVARFIPEGAVLTAGSVTEESLVRRGDRITLVASIPGMELRVMGEALEEGRLGRLIRVRNLESRRIISARVTGAGEVMVVE
jgi:flagella basal body P-ring formation protein FlgA